jgi:carbon monoxide dehydrogenase subunit G
MQLEFFLDQSPDVILRCLTQREHFVKTHPLIVDLQAVGEAEFRIKERMLYSVYPLYFTYNATIVSRDQNKQVWMNALIFGLINLSMKFQIVPEVKGTRVIENIEIKGFFLFRWVLSKVLRSQHQLWMQSIEKYKAETTALV